MLDFLDRIEQPGMPARATEAKGSSLQPPLSPLSDEPDRYRPVSVLDVTGTRQYRFMSEFRRVEARSVERVVRPLPPDAGMRSRPEERVITCSTALSGTRA
ncbi:hypothetical protein GCM10023220_58230 [Streptomyces ziwulingensis]|uniref:Uncharacterized protein n=1 Tax=Streptomyces ziwulingensis TaxID=1045501 RepID=A0ABP9CWH1_9ACTN